MLALVGPRRRCEGANPEPTRTERDTSCTRPDPACASRDDRTQSTDAPAPLGAAPRRSSRTPGRGRHTYSERAQLDAHRTRPSMAGTRLTSHRTRDTTRSAQPSTLNVRAAARFEPTDDRIPTPHVDATDKAFSHPFVKRDSRPSARRGNRTRSWLKRVHSRPS